MDLYEYRVKSFYLEDTFLEQIKLYSYLIDLHWNIAHKICVKKKNVHHITIYLKV